MPLYGHELSEDIDPITAGLEFAVKLDKPSFVGQSALVEIAGRPANRGRIGLATQGRREAREQYPVLSSGQEVGRVTSGSFSPTLQKPIAMAYVRPEYNRIGTILEVDIRGRCEPARVVELPFYSRSS